MRYDLILWDVDGTLLDFDRSERRALSDTFARYGHGFDEGMLSTFHRINDGLWKQYERGEIERDQVIFRRFRQLFDQCGVQEPRVDEFAAAYQRRMAQLAFLLPGAWETVSALAGRVRQCVATNGSAITQLPRLAACGLDRFMEQIFISERLGAPKPDPRFFDALFAALTPPPPRNRVLIVGDSLSSDMRGGRNAGVDTCWFCPGGGAPDEPVTWQIQELSQLERLLEE